MPLKLTANVFKTAWPLFFGLFMIMIGNGLQGTLLGVRASIEEFPTWMTGLIMSVYFIGFLAGTIMVPKFLVSVGHIRVFAALASMASTTVLFHGVFVDPIVWLPVRLITGFSFSGLYIVVESWLNDAATNKNRGMMMACYSVVSYLGIMLGQVLLNIADPEQIELFVVVSVLVSLALVPISLSTRPAPILQKVGKMKLTRLFKISPLGASAVFQSGFATATLFTILPVFASATGATTAEISVIMALIMFGGMLFQIPLGWLSDQMDRRDVILGATIMAAVFSLTAFWVSEGAAWLYMGILFVYGGLSMSIYGLSISHTNDHVEQDDIVAVSSAMLLFNGVGACFGPILVTAAMDVMGDEVFFPSIAITYLALFGFGVYRRFASEAVPLDDQGDYVAMPVRSSTMFMQMIEDEEGPVSNGD